MSPYNRNTAVAKVRCGTVTKDWQHLQPPSCMLLWKVQPDTDHVVPLQIFSHALLVHGRILLWQVGLQQRKVTIFRGQQHACEQSTQAQGQGRCAIQPPGAVASCFDRGGSRTEGPLADLLEGPFGALHICPLLHSKIAGLACSICHLLAQLAGCQLQLLAARRLSCRLQVQKECLEN